MCCRVPGYNSSGSGGNADLGTDSKEVVVDPDETLLIDLASDKVESDPWSNVKIVSDASVNEPGHWVMFDEQEEENMNYSFLQ